MHMGSKGRCVSFTCKHLTIHSPTDMLVDIGFSFERSFALIGQSGSGKSLTLKALLGMLSTTLRVKMDVEAPYPLIRGKSIAMVPQNPFTALSPLTKIGKQFGFDADVAQTYLEMVELEKGFLERFPSELSGGQLQRVIIAMALSIEPKLLLLDEPTTALDEESKKHILGLIQKVHLEQKFDLLFVTHDIETINGICEEIGILKQGKMVEYGMTKDVLHRPQEAYTKELLDAGFKQRSFRA